MAVGACLVGKTTLLKTYITGELEHHGPTIFETYYTTVTVSTADGCVLCLCLTITPGGWEAYQPRALGPAGSGRF